MKYFDVFINGYKGYWDYLVYEITHPSLHNYFVWLLLVSAFFFMIEVFAPWRKNQPRFRQDFWLDFFYMFFNFFIFSLVIYNAVSDVGVNLFSDFLGLFGIENLLLLQAQKLPVWIHLLIGFVLRDFIQWWIHRLLHYSEFLWEYHKVHHSVQQMGFAAHLRYHWMENVVYRTLEYIPLAMIGIGLTDFFIIHIFTLAVGHYNHSNISISGRYTAAVLGGLIGLFAIPQLGYAMWQTALIIVGMSAVFAFVLGPVMKYLFNSPEMHIWHHSYELPEDKRTGINFGLSLACWDYIFGTAHIPHDGRDIKLGFPGVEEFPKGFLEQNVHGFKQKKP